MASAHVSIDSLPKGYPSLCIPRVFNNITWKRVKDTLNDLDMPMGEIERVDMVRKTNSKGEKFQRAFIHFKSWNRNPTIDATRLWLLEKTSAGKNNMLKIDYEEIRNPKPGCDGWWFWKVGMSNAPKPDRKTSHSDTPKSTSKPTMSRCAPTTAPFAAKSIPTHTQSVDAMRAEIAELRRLVASTHGTGLGDTKGFEWGGSDKDYQSHTPDYTPTSPVYGATTPEYGAASPISSPPSIHRQGTGGSETCGTTGHIRRELAACGSTAK